MKIIHDPEDVLEIGRYGIDIPISFNNAKEAIRRMLEDRVQIGASSHSPTEKPPWYVDKLAPAPDRKALEAVHDPAYISRLLDSEESLRHEVMRTFELVDEDGKYHRYDPRRAQLPLEHLFQTLLARGGGAVRAAELAFDCGEAWYFGGGFHHGHYNHGSGFCMYHDVLVARHCVSDPENLPITWIIDMDAHKGDGTAALIKRMRDRGENDCMALSIHMAHGWPLDERRIRPGYVDDPAWTPSDLDIPLDSGEEDAYNDHLFAGLMRLSEMSKKRWKRETPEIAFVLAGADPFEEDMLPSTQLIKLSRTQMLRRNNLVRGFLCERNIPTAYVQAGNYGDNAWKTYVDFLSPLLD